MSDVVALDLGTSALKAIRFGDDGAVASSRSRAIATRDDGRGRREQDAGGWWDVAAGLLREALGEGEVAAIALSGTMQNLVPTARDGAPAGPAVLYSDARIGPGRRRALEARLPPDFARRTGNRPDGAQPVFKLMDLAEGGAGVDHWHFGAKDVLIERLTGERAIDATTATTTGLMAVRGRDWDDELLAAAGLDRTRVPPIVPGDAVVAATGGAALRAAGLPADVPVVCGAGDAGASAWGAGAEGGGAAHAYVGTSGWMAVTLDALPDDLPRDTYVLAMPSGAGALQVAPIVTAGAAVEWAAAATGRDVARAFAALGRARPDAASPLFLPYLSGERSPFEDAAVRGAFLGLDASHGPDDLFLAAIEGVGHALRHCLEAMEAEPAVIAAIGGGFRGAAMGPVVADALGRALAVAPHPLEATAFGAARMARRALGLADFAIDRTGAIHYPAGTGAAASRYRAYRAASRHARELAGTA